MLKNLLISLWFICVLPVVSYAAALHVGTIADISSPGDEEIKVSIREKSTGNLIDVVIADPLTKKRFKDRVFLVGDEVRCKSEEKDGKNVSKMFRKTSGDNTTSASARTSSESNPAPVSNQSTSVSVSQQQSAPRTGNKACGGVRDGQAECNYSNGNKFVGLLIDGKPNGKGVFTFKSGDVYEGSFSDGKRHGKGIYKWVSGNRYVGDFVDGKQTGKGVFTFASGKTRMGEFVDGKLVKEESTANTASASASSNKPASGSSQASSSTRKCNTIASLFAKYSNFAWIYPYIGGPEKGYLSAALSTPNRWYQSNDGNRYDFNGPIYFDIKCSNSDDCNSCAIHLYVKFSDGRKGLYSSFYDFKDLILNDNKLYGKAIRIKQINKHKGDQDDVKENEIEFDCIGNECSTAWDFKRLVTDGFLTSKHPLTPSVMAKVKAIELAQKKLKDADVVYAKANSAYEALRCEEALKLDRQGQAMDGRSHSSSDHSNGYRISFSSCVSERNFKQVLNGKNPQSMYLTAGKYERNGENSRAKEIYSSIVNRFPSSSWAVKANDRLLGIKADSDASDRQNEFEANRRRETQKASESCRSRKASCGASCSNYKDTDSRHACYSRCNSICSE